VTPDEAGEGAVLDESYFGPADGMVQQPLFECLLGNVVSVSVLWIKEMTMGRRGLASESCDLLRLTANAISVTIE
jgi:hypothetical protein